mgnify:FL=1
MLDRLFSPLTINGKTLKNRCVVTPMLMNFCEEDGTCTERFAAYHEAKAKGGFAMIVTENVAVTSVAQGYQWIPGLWKDEHIPGFRDLTDRVHQYDTVIIAQLNHPGRQASEKYAKAQSWAPSAIPDPYHNEEMPHEMTIAEIHKTVEDFGDAALRAKKAGFDGIELHGAHGYMIPEFMSMYTNKRTDEYGGDLTNRMRFALEIIENVRQKCGPDFILGYRLSADERVTGGLTIEDTKAIVPYLDQAGVDYFSISIAVNATDDQMIPSMYYRHGYQADYAKEVKDVTCKPVITVGRINDTRIAESILRSHKADLIGFARQSLTDPETPNKAREGRFEDIRKCVGCLHGCVGHIDTGLAGSCELNPLVGHESDPEYQTVPAEHPKKVMVVGAGPAGMQAAIAAAECGHQVEVYDSDRWAGGQYRIASIPPGKGEITAFLRWQVRELEKLHVPVFLNTTVTKELVLEKKPDVVVAATGVTPIVPKKIPGVQNPNVVLGQDVLKGAVNTGRRCVVVGGGLVGVEVANHLASLLKEVTVVEMRDGIALDEGPAPRKDLLQDLANNGAKAYTSNTVDEITDHSVIVSGAHNEEIPADTVVLAIGRVSNTALAEELTAAGVDVRIIGDAKEPGLAGAAIREGYLLGRHL